MREAAESVGRHHAMARHHDRKPVLSAGLADGARHALQRFRDGAVGRQAATRHRADGRPDFALEVRATPCQRQVEHGVCIGVVGVELFRHALCQRAGWRDFGKAVGQIDDFVNLRAIDTYADLAKWRGQDGIEVMLHGGWRDNVAMSDFMLIPDAYRMQWDYPPARRGRTGEERWRRVCQAQQKRTSVEVLSRYLRIPAYCSSLMF